MLEDKKIKMVLASNSPRRQEMLKWLNIPFEIIPSTFNEEKPIGKTVLEKVEYIASQKGKDICIQLTKRNDNQSFLVISADTIVELDGVIFGKPKSRSEASRVLLQLSGKQHNVITSVYLNLFNPKIEEGKELLFSTKTEVVFDNIDMDILNLYLDTSDSLDKAGGYGIQGMAQLFIKSIDGNYSNVVGLPINQVERSISKMINSKIPWRKLIVA
ncbi:MAG: septum formation protein Maf [Bdellovibrionales bacterium]|jgi:septum formation protein|nr:septum formation protein Maf [Bdellovibrionales bacterium]